MAWPTNERYVATDGDTTDAQATYDAAVDLAHACSLSVAFKYAVAGDRVNVKNGNKAGASAEYTRSASDTVTIDGTAASPICFRGYNSTIGDLSSQGRTGGNGLLDVTNFPVINYNGNYGLSFTNADYRLFESFDITSGRSGGAVAMGVHGVLKSCKIVNSANNSSATAVVSSVGLGWVINCDGSCTGASAPAVFDWGSTARFICCRILPGSYGIGFRFAASGGVAVGCIADNCAGDGFAFTSATATHTPPLLINCVAYSCGGDGYSHPNVDTIGGAVAIINSIFTECAGYGIGGDHDGDPDQACLFLNNRLMGNASGNIATAIFGDWASATSWDHVTSGSAASDDFTDAEHSDFTLKTTAASKAAGVLPYTDIGALQRQEPKPAPRTRPIKQTR